MSKSPFISICIPAYKNKAYLLRLMESIRIQTFRDFEVVITDDSPDQELQQLAADYSTHFSVQYVKNSDPLGSPANWNQSIRLAKGQWIKIMHDDDWFADKESLHHFSKATRQTNSSFIFSGFSNIDLVNSFSKTHILSGINKFMLKRSALYLFRTNYIGHPSTTLIKNNRNDWFDEQIRWVVDIEFYIRLLQENNTFFSIDESLIHIGVGSDQITRQVFRNPSFEIPENLYLLKKIGEKSLRNIFVYDYFWRLIRNLQIKSADDLFRYVKPDLVPSSVNEMIQQQNRWGQARLKKYGFLSKLMMVFSFLNSR
jgi:glycosyltransferase involved in cell wall biosynthesis